MKGVRLLTAVAALGVLGTGLLPAKVWISELVASNQTGLRDRDGDAEDWLELHNDGPEAVGLGGWSLTDDASAPRKWILPDVTLPVGGYLVIFASGENRRRPDDELHTNFSLNRSGEYLALVRPDGVTIEDGYLPSFPAQFEDVSYGPSETGGTTITLLAPGASGRAGVPVSSADFAANFAGWNSEVAGAFTGSSWRTVATGSGYDREGVYGSWLGEGGDFEAELFGQSGSLFVRLPFTVDDPGALTQLVLRMRWDDGFVAYLNGVEIASNRAPASPGWDSLATSERGDGENDDWQSFPIDLAAVELVAGQNLLAIQGLNDSPDSPDLLILPELEATVGGIGSGGAVYHVVPTPGAANGAGATSLPPLLTEVTSEAERPLGGAESAPIVVTATVRATSNPVGEVRLYHRRMFSPEVMTPMRDDGVAPDAVAGDGVYAAEVPTNVSRGTMIRWRVEAADDAGRVGRDPRFEVPDDADRYYGTVAVDPSLETSQLPVLETFVENESAVNTRAGGRVSIYHLGRFYDNVQMDLHGQSTAGSAFPKKSYDIDFNKGNRFLWREGEEKVKDINLLTNYADKSKVRNTMAYEFLQRCGSGYHFAFPVRVQRNGRFFSVVDLVEDGDDRFLDRIGLDGDGALYKMYDRLENANSASKKTRKHENAADLAALIARLDPSLPLDRRRLFAYDLVDIPATVNYLAALTTAGITDAGHKNYYMYRDTEGDEEWRPLPWDVDLSAGRRWTSSEHYFHDQLHHDFWNHGNINRLWELIFNAPDYRDMYLRRIATLREEVLLRPGTPEAADWYTQRVRELEDLVDPLEASRSDAGWDFQVWRSWGNNFQMRQATNRLLTEWLAQRRPWMFSPARNQGGVPVPARQPDVPRVTIEEYDVNPESGEQAEEYIVLQNREPFSVDLSGWTLGGAVEFTFPPGTVIPAGNGSAPFHFGLLHVTRNPKVFRARRTGPRGSQYRFIVGGYDGQLSARGETIELRNAAGALVTSEAYPGAPSLAQQYLRIVELNYHPEPPTALEEAAMPGVISEDFEWIEFLNVGPEALDLEGVRFTDGIEYTFEAGVFLAPGARLVLARNPSAFALRHPEVGGPVLGPYLGYLDNDGEDVRLVDAAGENVLSFEFNDRWYPPTDGGGHSLVLRDEAAPWNLYHDPESWGSSAEPRGTAGAAAGGYFVHFNGWQSKHFSASERDDPLVGGVLANPDGDPYANWEEYALGLDPFDADEALFHGHVVADGGQQFLGGIARRRARAIDLQWTLEVSADGVDWSTVADPLAPPPLDHGDGTETVTLRETEPVRNLPAKLARLRVRLTP